MFVFPFVCLMKVYEALSDARKELDSLPTLASEQGNVIGSVRIYIYNIYYI